jgi:hypothetical protein
MTTKVRYCDVCLHECGVKTVATEAVKMVDAIGLPVPAPMCERHFRAAAKVRIRYQIAPKLPLVLPAEAQTESQITH